MKVIDTDIIVMKIDVETYECKVIQIIHIVYFAFEELQLQKRAGL